MGYTGEQRKVKAIIGTQIDEQNSRINELEKDLRRKSAELDSLKSGLEQEILEIKKTSNRNIEILAIFTALLAFVSVEFQVFKIFNNIESITGATLILLGSLVMFVLLFSVFLPNGENYNSKFWVLLLISLGLVCSGVLILGTSDNFSEINIKKEEFDRYKTKNDELNSILNCLKDKGYISERCYQ